MKLKTLKNIAIFLLIAGMAGFYSCGKKKLNNATTSAEDNDLAESLFNEVFNAVSNESGKREEGSLKTGSIAELLDTAICAKVQLFWSTDTLPYLEKIIIVYETGCIYNGRTFEGTLTITKTGKWYEVNTETTITLGNDFYIDGYKVEGQKTVTTTSLDWGPSLGIILRAVFDISVINAKITTPDGEVLTWSSERMHTWTIETTTPFLFLRVDGTASGINRDDVSYTLTIAETLLWKVGCPYVVDGILKITSDDVKQEIVIDYGDGTCDDKATIAIGKKKPKDFTLK